MVHGACSDPPKTATHTSSIGTLVALLRQKERASDALEEKAARSMLAIASTQYEEFCTDPTTLDERLSQPRRDVQHRTAMPTSEDALR